MAPGVLALGTALVTVAGYVWYVPAVVDLRAGADRPVSRRAAATACVTGWATTAALAVVLLVGLPPWAVVGSAAAGWAATAALGLRARLLRRREEAEEAARWSALHRDRGGPGYRGLASSA